MVNRSPGLPWSETFDFLYDLKERILYFLRPGIYCEKYLFHKQDLPFHQFPKRIKIVHKNAMGNVFQLLIQIWKSCMNQN